MAHWHARGRGGTGHAAGAEMNTLFQFLVPIATIAVAVVLLLGLLNMVRGGSPNMSQKLMRWRVGLQFLAVIVIMTAIWFMQR
jgi:hypothetical protein